MKILLAVREKRTASFFSHWNLPTNGEEVSCLLKLDQKLWKLLTIPFCTLKPNWYLRSGLLIKTVVTGGHLTMFSLTRAWFFKPWKKLRVKHVTWAAKKKKSVRTLTWEQPWINRSLYPLYQNLIPECQTEASEYSMRGVIKHQIFLAKNLAQLF